MFACTGHVESFGTLRKTKNGSSWIVPLYTVSTRVHFSSHEGSYDTWAFIVGMCACLMVACLDLLVGGKSTGMGLGFYGARSRTQGFELRFCRQVLALLMGIWDFVGGGKRSFFTVSLLSGGVRYGVVE
jgi:hypothetical protein